MADFREIDSDEDLVTCGACGGSMPIDACDVIKSCPGNLFCLHCNVEIDGDGVVQLLCGECNACHALIVDGVFSKEQEDRKLVISGPR